MIGFNKAAVTSGRSSLFHFTLTLLLVPVSFLSSAPAAGTGYEEARSAAVDRCAAIDPATYQTGLLFNPDGYRSYYVRSECFQDAAVEFRDAALCRQVRQRRSLFSSSWGYSPSRCRQLVQEGLAKDRSELEQVKRLYAEDGMRWRDFRVERNGNGRDFDIIPSFDGAYAHGYRLTFEILQTDRTRTPVLLHSDGYFVDRTGNLRIYVRQADIRQRFAAFELARSYRVRATIVLDIGSGGPSGRWSDSFIDSVFPVRERSRSLEKPVVF